MKFHSTILTATLLAVVLLLAGSCSRQGERSARKITDADSLIEAAHQSHNYEVLRQLVDSFQRAGSLSDIQANYWLGYVYSRKGQQRIAEIHWKMRSMTKRQMRCRWITMHGRPVVWPVCCC